MIARNSKDRMRRSYRKEAARDEQAEVLVEKHEELIEKAEELREFADDFIKALEDWYEEDRER